MVRQLGQPPGVADVHQALRMPKRINRIALSIFILYRKATDGGTTAVHPRTPPTDHSVRVLYWCKKACNTHTYAVKLV